MEVPVGLVPTSSSMQTEIQFPSVRASLKRSEEHTVGLNEWAKGVEEPSVAI
jgi:hypothetical protein